MAPSARLYHCARCHCQVIQRALRFSVALVGQLVAEEARE
jgi:hypothetical protein